MKLEADTVRKRAEELMKRMEKREMASSAWDFNTQVQISLLVIRTLRPCFGLGISNNGH